MSSHLCDSCGRYRTGETCPFCERGVDNRNAFYNRCADCGVEYCWDEPADCPVCGDDCPECGASDHGADDCPERFAASINAAEVAGADAAARLDPTVTTPGDDRDGDQ